MDSSQLASRILSDRSPLFAADFERQLPRLRGMLADRNVLVLGAGGSIGRATAHVLLECRPRRTMFVDISENNLAEVTRQLRNRFHADAPEFDSWALDFRGTPFRAMLEENDPDIILNFAAFKHVRSEKDQYTIAEMLLVNTIGNMLLLDWLHGRRGKRRMFVISTDKAVNPVSCMGATKRLMERLLFSTAADPGFADLTVTTTRFANVLFSDGSLPASFLSRLELGQPLAGPDDIERYFITPEEAGRLCLLAACHEPGGEILVPAMRPADLMKFDEIARRLLQLRGYEMKNYGTDTEAAFAGFQTDTAAGSYPCLFSPSTTSGEKSYEEFVEVGETEVPDQPYAEIRSIASEPRVEFAELRRQLTVLNQLICDPPALSSLGKAGIVKRIAELVPSFRHIETGLNLDRRI